MIELARAPQKRRLLPWLRAVAGCVADEVPACLAAMAHPNLAWHGPHPLGAMHGLEAVARRFWRPLKHAFPDLERRDDVVLGGGPAPPHADTSEWVAATGHFVGIWRRDWLGLPATGNLTFLRFGEFHRVHELRVVESRVLLDLPDLMRQAGCNPLAPSPGAAILTPGPATQDGVSPEAGSADESARSLELVQRLMLPPGRRAAAPDRSAAGCYDHWARDHMRYGPGGLGATRGWPMFHRRVRQPFLAAFPDQSGVGLQAFIADGAYAACTGWPALDATHQGAFLGLAPTGARVGIRLMEFWRRDGSVLAESWAMMDLPDLMIQLGRDLMAEAREAALLA